MVTFMSCTHEFQYVTVILKNCSLKNVVKSGLLFVIVHTPSRVTDALLFTKSTSNVDVYCQFKATVSLNWLHAVQETKFNCNQNHGQLPIQLALNEP